MKTKEEFEARWPELMADVPCGFYCPKGWTDLVWKLMEDIEAELDGTTCDFRIAQVKENSRFCSFDHRECSFNYACFVSY